MGSKERISRLKESTKVNIIEAAHKIVREEGCQALSMRKIADRIEYTAPMIYEYFANKEAILLALTKKGYEMLGERMKTARDAETTPEKQLEALWLAYWNFAFEEKEFYSLMFGVEVSCCVIESFVDYESTPYGIATVPIMKLMNIDDPDDDRICTKYYTYWSVIHGLVSINIVRKGASDQVNRQVLMDAITGITRSLTN